MKPRYYAYSCRLCEGGKSRHDATLADKVCSGGNTAVRCSRCDGNGYHHAQRQNADPFFYGERMPEHDIYLLP